MKQLLSLALAAGFFAAASPAAATQGILCTTDEAEPMTLSLMAGTYPGATWSAKMQHGTHWMPMEVGQHWIDDKRMLLQLIDTDEMHVIATIDAASDGQYGWSGMLKRGDTAVPIRCEQN